MRWVRIITQMLKAWRMQENSSFGYRCLNERRASFKFCISWQSRKIDSHGMGEFDFSCKFAIQLCEVMGLEIILEYSSTHISIKLQWKKFPPTSILKIENSDTSSHINKFCKILCKLMSILNSRNRYTNDSLRFNPFHRTNMIELWNGKARARSTCTFTQSQSNEENYFRVEVWTIQGNCRWNHEIIENCGGITQV